MSRHLQAVQRRDKVLPLDRVGASGTGKAIQIDGHLDEWSSLAQRSGLLIQDLDHLAYQLSENARDAAGVKLLYDDKALYIAVRVIDASVYNVTKTEREYIRQDCVELFFDVRPPATSNIPKLGDPQRSDGFYQLFFVPPTPARQGHPAQPVRWCSAPAQADLKSIGPLEVAASLRSDGYELEIRIPYTSFTFATPNGASAERFEQPIGFDVFVNDMDIDLTTGQTTASGVYSWGGLTGAYANPSRLAAASRETILKTMGDTRPSNNRTASDRTAFAGTASAGLPFLRTVPARIIAPRQAFVPEAIDAMDNTAGHHYALRAALLVPSSVASLGASRDEVPDETITLTLDYSATAFDSPLPTHQPTTKLGSLQSRSYPGLDTTVFFRDLTLLELPGGRYTCHSAFDNRVTGARREQEKRDDDNPAEGNPINETRYYAWIKESGTALLQVPSESLGLDGNRAFRQSLVLVEPASHYPNTNEPVQGRLSVDEYSLSPAALWSFSQEAEQAARQGQDLPLAYRVAVHAVNEERPVGTLEVPFRAYPVRFAFPPSTFKTGDYEIKATPIEKKITGQTIRINEPAKIAEPIKKDEPLKDADPIEKDEQRPKPEAVPLTVTLPRPLVMPAIVRDAPEVWMRAMEIGSPLRDRHPLDDAYNAPQRSISALQWFENRIYVGSGIDYQHRPYIPPTTDDLDIWSFSPVQARAESKTEWVKETRLLVSQATALRASGDRLYVSTLRNRWWQPSYPVHVKSQGKWETLSQPTGWQLGDLLPFEDKLYAASATDEGATLLESSDGGRTWKTAGTLGRLYSGFDLLAPLPQGLLATTSMSERGAALYSNGKLEPLRVNLFPGYPARRGLTTSHLQSFAGGVLYTPPAEFDQTPKHRPLFFLEDLTKGAMMIEPFAGAVVQDIKIREGRCYVLTATPEKNGVGPDGEGLKDEGFVAAVFSSPDLKVWTKQASVTLPALPNALEIAENAFFIGLSNRHFGYADPASGSIWMIWE